MYDDLLYSALKLHDSYNNTKLAPEYMIYQYVYYLLKRTSNIQI